MPLINDSEGHCCICTKLFRLANDNQTFRELIGRQKELYNDLLKLYDLIQHSPGFSPGYETSMCPIMTPVNPIKSTHTSVMAEPSATVRNLNFSECQCPHELMKKIASNYLGDINATNLPKLGQQKTNLHEEVPHHQGSDEIPIQSQNRQVHNMDPTKTITFSAPTDTCLTVYTSHQNIRLHLEPTLNETHSKTCLAVDGENYGTRKHMSFQKSETATHTIPSQNDTKEPNKTIDFQSAPFLSNEEPPKTLILKGKASSQTPSAQSNIYIWTICSYRAIEALDCGYWSSAFYLGNPGYRMRAKLEFTTYHLGIFIQLIPGEFDDVLPWPFRYNLQFIIIDQTLSGKNLSRTLKPYPEDEDELGVWDRPTNDGMDYSILSSGGCDSTAVVRPDAWGLPDFAPRTMLVGKHGESTEYVRNDRMHVAIRLV